MLWWGSFVTVGGGSEASLNEMILPELLLSTSLISLAIFLWTFLHQWKSEDDECGSPSTNIVQTSGPCTEDVQKLVLPSQGGSREEGGDESSVAEDRDTPLSSTPSTPRASLKSSTHLSRRQRKNRKRDKENNADVKVVKTKKSPALSRKDSDEKNSAGELLQSPTTTLGPGMKSKKRGLPTCKQFDKLGAEDHEIFNYFTSYLLSFDQMRQMGFPQDSSLYPGKAYIYRDPDFCHIFPDGNGSDLDDGEFCENKLDANAKPFFPTSGSSSSSSTIPAKKIDDMLDYFSDSEGSGDSSDKSCGGLGNTQGRKKSLEDVSGIALNVTAKEFVPGSPHPTVSQTKSAPNLVKSFTRLSSISSSASSLSLTANVNSGTEDGLELVADVAADDTEASGDSNAAAINTEASDSNSAATETKASDAVEASDSNTTATDTKDSDSRLVDDRLCVEELVDRRCVRCCKSFTAGSLSGAYLTPESCSFHWGKLRSRGKAEPVFTCCNVKASRQARGCSTNTCHVWTGVPSQGGILGPLEGYVKTKHRKSYPTNGNFGVYGLDCEMCYTLHGLELAKVTVVGIDGRLVYETLVLPETDIIDHNTRFSGVTAKDLEKGPTKNLKEVQNDLMGFINADTVLVGHGLENDLRALKMIHGVVLDTSTVFPHFYGLPFRRSLRSLVSSYLKREIQVNSWGHDSYEDARACVELMLWKTRKDNAASSRKLPRQTKL